MTSQTVLRSRSTSCTPLGSVIKIFPLGKGVTETEPHGKAAGEIDMLRKWVFEQLQMCTPARVPKKKAVSHG